MIIVHGTIPLKPACREQALNLARRMADATRGESGCLSYDFYIGLAEPNTLMLFQEWENMEVLMAHFQTGHMEEFLKELPALVSGEITTKRYAVKSVDEEGIVAEENSPTIH